MKKIVLLAGAAALLAACSPSFNGGQTSTVLTLGQVTSFSSQYSTSQDYTDTNTGRFIPAGTYIICDNRTTPLQFNFTWNGPLYQAGARLKGYTTGNTSDTIIYDTNPGGDTSGSGSGNITVPAYVAPLKVSFHKSISSQAIIPTPLPPAQLNVKGYTYLQVVAVDTAGLNSNVIESNTIIPVANCTF